jgi:hypothetical protein
MESKRRFWAQDWWTHLPTNYRQECMPFSGRNPESLTGREIEHLYCLDRKKKFADEVLNILTSGVADIPLIMKLAEKNNLGEIGEYPLYGFSKL